MRRVVVTGMGMVTPLGCGVETTWSRLLKGESGAKKIETFNVSDISCKIAGVVPRGDGSRRHLQSRSMDGAEGAAQGRRFHRVRHVRGAPGARRCRLASAKQRGAESHRRADRFRHRRRRTASTKPRSWCTKKVRAAFRRSSCRAASSIWCRATFDPNSASRAPIMRWSPPARPAPTPSAMPRG